MLNFAVASYRSTIHRWWFNMTPPPTRPTRIPMPRFIVPRDKSARHARAPFSTYARLLNGLTETEWQARNLPIPEHTEFKPDSGLTVAGVYVFKIQLYGNIFWPYIQK